MRSLLFVPGTHPERFGKALESGADAVCIDLEDSVASARKVDARGDVMSFLMARPSDPRIWVRVNASATAACGHDLQMLRTVAGPLQIILPKAESLHDVEALGTVSRVLPIIETPKGVAAVEQVAAVLPSIAGLLFGSGDLSVLLGCSQESHALLYARSKVVLAARIGGIDVLDGPFLGVEDDAGLEADCRHAASLGFQGKVAIHPRQIQIIHQCFKPTARELMHAEAVVAAFTDNEVGVAVVDGRMVDGPFVQRARRLVAETRSAN